jgi:hypothetical protein
MAKTSVVERERRRGTGRGRAQEEQAERDCSDVGWLAVHVTVDGERLTVTPLCLVNR